MLARIPKWTAVCTSYTTFSKGLLWHMVCLGALSPILSSIQNCKVPIKLNKKVTELHICVTAIVIQNLPLTGIFQAYLSFLTFLSIGIVLCSCLSFILLSAITRHQVEQAMLQRERFCHRPSNQLTIRMFLLRN